MCKYYLAFNYKVKCTFTMNISHNYHVNSIVMSGKMCTYFIYNFIYKVTWFLRTVMEIR